MASPELKTTRELAWIGDAVLSLHIRRWILKSQRRMDGEMLTRCTSNRFLASLGNPTEVEARIGRIHEAEGLAAAGQWIDSEILPTFQKQEANRRKH